MLSRPIKIAIFFMIINFAAALTQAVKVSGAAWKFTQLGANLALPKRSDLYTIESNVGGTFKCLFFGNDGKDIYPSLQTCEGYPQGRDCPWFNPGKKYCGWGGADGLTALVNNGQVCFRRHSLCKQLYLYSGMKLCGCCLLYVIV